MSQLITNAILMVGGEGKRLRPYTQETPKPMLMANNIPLLQHIIQQLMNVGISKFFLCVNYLSHKIIDYFGNGSAFHTNIEYIHEPFCMGTIGAVSLLKNKLKNPFLLMNGDIYTDLDFRDFFVHFWKSNSDLYICSRSHETQDLFGIIQIQDDDVVVNWDEKPKRYSLINCGIYIINTTILQSIPDNHYFNANHLAKLLIKQKRLVKTYEMPKHIYWNDIGNIHDYNKLLNFIGN